MSPLHYAAMLGASDAAGLLLGAGADAAKEAPRKGQSKTKAVEETTAHTHYYDGRGSRGISARL